MKVREVNPGYIANVRGHWVYTIHINGKEHFPENQYDNAATAKQAMRERVHWLRKHHGLLMEDKV